MILCLTLVISFTSLSANVLILSNVMNSKPVTVYALNKVWTKLTYTANGWISLTVNYDFDPADGKPYITSIQSYGCTDPNYSFYKSSFSWSQGFALIRIGQLKKLYLL